jgi:uncharacterized protein (TIGR02246 family)
MRISIVRRRTTRLLPVALLLTVSIAACDNHLVEPKETVAGTLSFEEAATQSPMEARATLNPAQTRAIDALLISWEAAWAAKDVPAMVAHYTEDVDWVNPLGGVLSGREQISSIHNMLFSGPFAGSTQTGTIRRAVSLTGAVMLVDLDVTLTGYQALLPGLAEFEPGVVRVRVKWVVVREGSALRIMAQHMTAVQPPPPAP